MLEKFGTVGIVMTEERLEKRKKTMQDRYGGYGAGSPIIREKIISTTTKRLGVPHSLMSETVQQKQRVTNMKRYGVPHPLMNTEVMRKAVITWESKYGVSNPAKSRLIKIKMVATWKKNYDTAHPMRHSEVCGRSLQTRLDHYGTLAPSVYGRTEQMVADAVTALGVAVTRQRVLKNGKVIDILCTESNIGIEYCGLRWHHENSPEPRDKTYHHGKMLAASNEGIRLITIFGDEWAERRPQVLNALKSILNRTSVRLGARVCQESVCDKKTAQTFLEQNHIQGKASNIIYARGLWYGDALVGVMTFGRHHRQGRPHDLVLNRMCFVDDTSVAGGASRMFKAACMWAKINNYQKIVSWSDNRWFTGRVYAAIGMVLTKELPPAYSYVSIKEGKTRLSKQSQKKASTGCPADMTELEWTTSQGLSRIWDCGRKRWELSL
jgi:hypothetical protein